MMIVVIVVSMVFMVMTVVMPVMMVMMMAMVMAMVMVVMIMMPTVMPTMMPSVVMPTVMMMVVVMMVMFTFTTVMMTTFHDDVVAPLVIRADHNMISRVVFHDDIGSTSSASNFVSAQSDQHDHGDGTQLQKTFHVWFGGDKDDVGDQWTRTGQSAPETNRRQLTCCSYKIGATTE
jgi:Ca2+/Na+ antiporter